MQLLQVGPNLSFDSQGSSSFQASYVFFLPPTFEPSIFSSRLENF